MIFSTFALFAVVAAAVPVELEWMHDKSSGDTVISIFGTDGDLLAKSCGSYLNASTPIDFTNTDAHGNGNFTVGSKHYTVHELQSYSGGLECTKKYNGDTALVDCKGLNWEPEQVHTGNTNKCPDLEAHFFRKARGARAHLQNRAPPEEWQFKEITIGERDDTHCGDSRIDLLGNGDPHQNYRDSQEGEVITCASSASCSTGQSQSFTISVGFSVTSAATPSWGWIGGGFDVSASWGTTQVYSCNGNPGDTICVWHNTAHTAYTVTYTAPSCPGNPGQTTDPYVMFSPNNANRGGGFYCVVGTCRAQGDFYWDYSGPAGGP